MTAVLLSAPAWAATVTNTNDSGSGSLRQAIADAAAGDTISLAPGTITLTSGELVINKDLTISGPGSGKLTIQRSTAGGTPEFRIFNVTSSTGTITISGLTVSNGLALFGGGINNEGSLTLDDCAITGNVAKESGGGVANRLNGSSLTLINSFVTGNSVATLGIDGWGAGVYNGPGTMVVTHCTVSNNSLQADAGHDAYGGGVYNEGSLTITGSKINGNHSTGGGDADGGGGGIFNDNQLTLATSTVDSNTATGGAGSGPGRGYGGGIANGGGDTTLDRSTVSGNFAVGGAGSDSSSGGSGEGGGIAVDFDFVTVDTSTVSGNTSSGGAGNGAGSSHGGGIFNHSFAALFNSTVATNVVNVVPTGFTGDGGGIYNINLLELKNTIVVANTATVDFFNKPYDPNVPADPSGSVYSDGFNLIGKTNGLDSVGGPFDPASDWLNRSATEVNLGPLQDNGGPTFTHALLCASFAIDKGDNTNSWGPATDQRGFPRPEIVGGLIDIGAYEARKNTPPTITNVLSLVTMTCASPSCSATISVNVADADGDPLSVVWTVDGKISQTTSVTGGGPVSFTGSYLLGAHDVTITVTDPSMCRATWLTTVIMNAEPTPCPAGVFSYSVSGGVGTIDNNGDLNIRYDQFPAPNDNSYGLNAIGWSNGHTFGNLSGSDKAGFQLRDPNGVVRLEFYIDTLSATAVTAATPSGYKSLGPFGGDGRVVVGTLTPADIAFDHSLARNLNNTGYCRIKVVNSVNYADCTTGGINLLVNSPPTDANHATYVISNSALLKWDFHNTFFVTIKKAKLDSLGFVKETWKVEPDLVALHNSPAKRCPATTVVGASCSLTIGTQKISSKTVQIAISNKSTTADAIMTALRLSWPAANGMLVQVKLGSNVVYDIPDMAWSATGVTLGAGGSQPLVSDTTKLLLRKNTNYTLQLIFQNSAVQDLSQYTSTASFGTGCLLEIL